MGSIGLTVPLIPDHTTREFEIRVMEAVKRCEEGAVMWAMEVARCVGSTGLGFPSPELACLVVSLIFPDGGVATSSSPAGVWKFLNQAVSLGQVSSLHVIALLTPRVIAHRWSQPESFRLYLEILSRYFFSFDGIGKDDCRIKIITSVDVTLQLSQTYGIPITELGQAVVFTFFSIIIGLIDSMMSDWGLQMIVEKSNIVTKDTNNHIMHLESGGNQNHGRTEHRENLRRSNSIMAFEVLGKLTEHKKGMVLLRLVYLNMPEKFNGLLQRMQFLKAQKLASPYLKSASQLFVKLSENIQKALGCEYKLNKRQLVGMLIDIRSSKASSCDDTEFGRFACWAPFDIYMENAMDGKQFPVTSAIDILAETIYTLNVFNRASWHDTFLALWLAALRLVQRERDPLEGPVPHLKARLCILLAITPLAISLVLEMDDSVCYFPGGVANIGMENENRNGIQGNNIILRKQGLVSSLQVLGQYTSLLCPPASGVSAANNAAAKAAAFISNYKNKEGLKGNEFNITSNSPGADMRHLIVEACLARKLIDTSAYSWPGYVSASVTSLLDSSRLEICPWSRFLEGAPLTSSLISTLMMTPASSLVQVEKLYHIALNGAEEERSAAAKILCGASLGRGWNIQEHVVNFVLKLLTPPRPPNFAGNKSHLIYYTSMLSAILFGASSVDTVHILSLHGVVPQVAASLMPLCETFGSLVPTSNHKSSSGNESSTYMVFSSAFLFLLRLWKFYRPPLEQGITARGGVIGGELTLEYLLLLRNSRIQISSIHGSTSNEAIYIDSYPKLRAWYCQNRSCIASTLSGLCSGNPVHQVANKLLNMMYWKITKNETISSDSSSQLSGGATGPSGEDTYQRPILPAWEVLEAVPFVLEAILTACSHGKLSSRDLITGLRVLVDFLPASLAAIISYFSAEVTRGIWKPAAMNGTDWPSPAVNLSSIESEIKDILAAVGVTVPSCSYGVSTVTLPLPMAILVSLTITFKLDKSLEYILAVAGPAMENCAAGCPWPSMPIVGSLWAQKIRRWHDFIVVSCSRSVFKENPQAISQLLKSCFASFLGPPQNSSSPLTGQFGVNGLLGNFISAPGHYPRVAPGFLYLRTCRTINDVHQLNNVILELVANSARELATKWASTENPRLRSNNSSLAMVVSKIKEISTLGATLISVAGGVQLVQELYQETIPTWLLSSRGGEKNDLFKNNIVSKILEGYSMAYLCVLSGACIWGVGAKPPSWALSRRLRGVAAHMEFLVGVLDGNVACGCDRATWQAYVLCLVGLMVSFAPVWIRQVKRETLVKLANGLRGWHECELALALLERGGVEAMGSVVQFLNGI